jgi:hypothetical protein
MEGVTGRAMRYGLYCSNIEPQTPASHTDTPYDVVGEVVATEGDQDRYLPHKDIEITLCL